MAYKLHKIVSTLMITGLVMTAILCCSGATAFAGTTCGDSKNGGAVKTSIDLGCQGKGNPILDMTFGIIRFLSAGVGIVIVGSMVVAGIQYTSARGDPNASARAKGRIQSNVIALLVFIFAYAILDYVIPGAILK